MITKHGYKLLGIGVGLAFLFSIFSEDDAGSDLANRITYGGSGGGCGCGG